MEWPSAMRNESLKEKRTRREKQTTREEAYISTSLHKITR
jgi:hypothetical protein